MPSAGGAPGVVGHARASSSGSEEVRAPRSAQPPRTRWTIPVAKAVRICQRGRTRRARRRWRPRGRHRSGSRARSPAMTSGRAAAKRRRFVDRSTLESAVVRRRRRAPRASRVARAVRRASAVSNDGFKTAADAAPVGSEIRRPVAASRRRRGARARARARGAHQLNTMSRLRRAALVAAYPRPPRLRASSTGVDHGCSATQLAAQAGAPLCSRRPPPPGPCRRARRRSHPRPPAEAVGRLGARR